MTRKDYEAIAQALNHARLVGAPTDCANQDQYMRGADDQAYEYFSAIARVLSADNPRFDRAKFLAACGVNL